MPLLQQYHCTVMHGLLPLLHYNDYIRPDLDDGVC